MTLLLLLSMTIALQRPQIPHRGTQWRAGTQSPLRAQSVDFSSLYGTVAELTKTFVPSIVENVVQENEYNLYLGVKTHTGTNLWLQFCWHPSTARVGLANDPPRPETSPFSFASTLRALLKSLTITKVSMPRNEFDRIIEMELSERLSEARPKWKLILEVMGSRSNLILVSCADNTIQAVAYQVGTSTTVRPLQTNGVYNAPPSGGGIFSPVVSGKDGTDVSSLHVIEYPLFSTRLMQMVQLNVERALVAVYRGMSPNIARSILAAAHIPCDQPVPSLTSEQLQSIYRYFAAWAALFATQPSNNDSSNGGLSVMAVLRANLVEYPDGKTEYVPVTFVDRGGGSESSAAVVDRPPPPSDTPLSTFLSRFYSQHERRTEFDAQRAVCVRKLAQRVKKATKLDQDFEFQLSEASGEKADQLKAQGDLITSYTHSWVDKHPTLQCYDFATGEPIVVDIPYGTTPSEYAQRVYKKARKLKRSVAVLENLLVRTRGHLAYLSEIETALVGLQEYRVYEDIVALREIDEVCSVRWGGGDYVMG